MGVYTNRLQPTGDLHSRLSGYIDTLDRLVDVAEREADERESQRAARICNDMDAARQALDEDRVCVHGAHNTHARRTASAQRLHGLLGGAD